MIQIIHKTYAPIGGITSHYITAYDENCTLIDIVGIEERNGRVIECKSIYKKNQE